MYDAYQQRIAECDQALEQHLKHRRQSRRLRPPMPSPRTTPCDLSPLAVRKRRRKAGSHTPQFDLGRELHRISGVDLDAD